MIDWTKPIQTKDGRKARLLGTLAGNGRRIIAISNSDTNEELYEVLFADGSQDGGWGKDNIINVPEKMKVHIYRDGLGMLKICESCGALAYPELVKIVGCIIEIDRI